MNAADALGTDDVPCAIIRITKDRRILWANDYLVNQYGYSPEALSGANIATIFTRASKLFCDSYVYPKAMAEQICREVQLTILTGTGERRPVVASAKMLPDGGFSWVFIEADNRNRLFEELEAARSALQRSRAQLEDLTRTDPLTEVMNRRGLDEGLAHIFAEADRYGQPVSVLLIDIDQFKSINDVHGHQVGDRVLALLASTLKMICREHDLVGRFGGDEFACVLNHTEVAAAGAVCKRIHKALADRSRSLGGFTVSIGVAGRTRSHPLSLAEVLQRADSALYRAKAGGRNGTCLTAADEGAQEANASGQGQVLLRDGADRGSS